MTMQCLVVWLKVISLILISRLKYYLCEAWCQLECRCDDSVLVIDITRFMISVIHSLHGQTPALSASQRSGVDGLRLRPSSSHFIFVTSPNIYSTSRDCYSGASWPGRKQNLGDGRHVDTWSRWDTALMM